MIEFLTEHWQFIVVCVAGLTEFILMIVLKKRPQIVDNSIMVRLAEWILYAEQHFVIGSDKMKYVLGEASKYLGDKYVEKDIRNAVEYLLLLPEKKEGN